MPGQNQYGQDQYGQGQAGVGQFGQGQYGQAEFGQDGFGPDQARGPEQYGRPQKEPSLTDELRGLSFDEEPGQSSDPGRPRRRGQSGGPGQPDGPDQYGHPQEERSLTDELRGLSFDEEDEDVRRSRRGGGHSRGRHGDSHDRDQHRGGQHREDLYSDAQYSDAQYSDAQYSAGPPGGQFSGGGSQTRVGQPGAGQFGAGQFGAGQPGAGQFGADHGLGQYGPGQPGDDHGPSQPGPDPFGADHGPGQYGPGQYGPGQPGDDHGPGQPGADPFGASPFDDDQYDYDRYEPAARGGHRASRHGAPGDKQRSSNARKLVGSGAAVAVVAIIGGAIVVPKLLSHPAPDPACTTYNSSVLPDYNKMVDDLNSQAKANQLDADMVAAIRALTGASGQAQSSKTQSALSTLLGRLDTVQKDAKKGFVPAATVRQLNNAADAADAAC
jgi:hypothetical protein